MARSLAELCLTNYLKTRTSKQQNFNIWLRFLSRVLKVWPVFSLPFIRSHRRLFLAFETKQFAWLDFNFIGQVISFVLSFSPFMNENIYNCFLYLSQHVFGEGLTYVLVLQVHRWRGILPQDGLCPELHSQLISIIQMMKSGTCEQ